MVNAAAAKAGIQVKFVNTPWEGIFNALGQGDRDMIASSVTITNERKQTMDFTNPYFDAVQLIAVKDNTKIAKFSDLKKAKIGVQTGTTGDEAVTKLLGKTSTAIKRFESTPLALKELEAGGVDAVVADNGVVIHYVANNPGSKFKTVADKVFVPEQYGFAVKKGNAELLGKMNEGIAGIKADGCTTRSSRSTSAPAGDGRGSAGGGSIEVTTSAGAATSNGRPAAPKAVAHPAGAGRGTPRPGVDIEGAAHVRSAVGDPLGLRPALRERAVDDDPADDVPITLGLALGVLLGLVSSSADAPKSHSPLANGLLATARAITLGYVSFFRGTPLFVQILLMHFALLPLLIHPVGGLRASRATRARHPPGLRRARLGRAGAHAECRRLHLGDLSRRHPVDRPRPDRRRALARPAFTRTMHSVVLPQAFRRMLPPLGNNAIALMKDSSLVSAIGLSELA